MKPPTTRLTATYTSTIAANREGGLAIGSPEAHDAVQRVIAQLRSTRRKGSHAHVIPELQAQSKGGKA